MSSNMTHNQNSKPLSKVRPKSSIFPPLVSTSPEHNLRERSSSFDYSFSDLKLNLQSNKTQNKSKSPISKRQPKERYAEQALKEESSEALESVVSLLARSPTDECQRLKNENQVLKNNFLRMSRIIQKHSRLMAKKDDIILKLQEKSSTNYLPVIQTTSQNIGQSKNELGSFTTQSISSTETSSEIYAKNTEFSMKFRQIYDSMITNFSQHLTQFMKVIEEMLKFLENNLKMIDRKNSDHFENNSEFEAKIQTLNADYSELKNNYEVLIKQNKGFKSFTEFVINSCNSEPMKDLSSSESVSSLRQHFTELLSKNQSLNDEIKVIQNIRQSEEDYCFQLIEYLSDIELELELRGRIPQTLNKVIEMFEQKLESTHHMLSQTYFDSLNKTLLQIYKNHLKWFQFVNKPSKSTQTWIQTRGEDSSSDEEEMASKDKQQISGQIRDKSKTEETKNEISEEIKSKFNELSDDISFDDFDIETINDILMAKYFDLNLKSNLEVVEEVEEENIEEEEEEEIDISYEDNVFEEVNELSENYLNVSENNVKNECNVENIESVVEQVLNGILVQIESQLSLKECSNQCLDNMHCSPSPTSGCPQSPINEKKDSNEPKVVDIKLPYIDSDFVSDDLSSSPETVMTYSDNINIHSKSTLKSWTTLDQLKQLNSRQSSEVDFAKTRIQQLQSIISEDQNSDESQQKYDSKENQYLSDELNAWKELVEQQNTIMAKVRNELELQQKMNDEKDRAIESLESQSKNESLAKIFENQTSVQQNSEKCVDVSDDECNTSMDELELNNLFGENSSSDDKDIEVITFSPSVDQRNVDKKSPDILIQEAWDKHDGLTDKNYVSDESSANSVFTCDSSPLSVPEELLSNRRKVFIPFSHEDAAVRRHSCQDRLINYGDHPRKKKLHLKNVDIVFQPQQKEKRRAIIINKK